MHLPALLFTAMLATAPSAKAHAQPSPPDSSSSPKAAEIYGLRTAKEGQAADLPFSLDCIREALERKPLVMLCGLNEQSAHFRVEIEERRKIEKLLATLNFKSGPAVPGGPYGYEQQRLLNPSTKNPLGQPYVQYSTGELLTIAIENLVGRYLGGCALNAVSGSERLWTERAAREEVARSMAEFCAGQPDRRRGSSGLLDRTGKPLNLIHPPPQRPASTPKASTGRRPCSRHPRLATRGESGLDQGSGPYVSFNPV